MTNELTDIERTLRKMLKMDTDDCHDDTNCQPQIESQYYREDMVTARHTHAQQLYDLEKHLNHLPSGPPAVAPFSNPMTSAIKRDDTNASAQKVDWGSSKSKDPIVFKEDHLSHPLKVLLTASKKHTVKSKEFSKVDVIAPTNTVEKGSRNHQSSDDKDYDANHLLGNHEEWPELPTKSAQEEHIPKTSENFKEKKQRKKKAKRKFKDAAVPLQNPTRQIDQRLGRNEGICVTVSNTSVEAGSRTVEVRKQTVSNSPASPLHQLERNNRNSLKGSEAEMVRNDAAVLENQIQRPKTSNKLINMPFKHACISGKDPSVCAIPTCPKKAIKCLDRYNLAMYDRDPKSLPPGEIMDIFREQKILPMKKKSARHPKARYFCHLCEYHCDNLIVCKKHLSSFGHISLKEAEELDFTLCQLPFPNEAQTDSINELLTSLVKDVGLTEADVVLRRNVVKELSTFLMERLPDGCKLELYGSSESGLGLKDCVIDVDLFVPSDATLSPAQALVCALDVITQQPSIYEDVKTDWGAKWPTIDFKHRTTRLCCVLGLNFTEACKTTQLIRNYVQLDPRVQLLCTALRYWAKECGVDRQAEGTLPPHAFDLMVLYYLQHLETPVLPVLHAMSKNDAYLEAEEAAKCWKTKNQKRIGFLWVELFRYYSLIHPNSGLIISIRESEPMAMAQKNWRGQKLAIEDPFLFKRNLARSLMSWKSYNFILSCFKLTFKYFAIPQTINGPLFDCIPRPSYDVSCIGGLKSEEKKASRLNSVRSSENGSDILAGTCINDILGGKRDENDGRDFSALPDKSLEDKAGQEAGLPLSPNDGNDVGHLIIVSPGNEAQSNSGTGKSGVTDADNARLRREAKEQFSSVKELKGADSSDECDSDSSEEDEEKEVSIIADDQQASPESRASKGDKESESGKTPKRKGSNKKNRAAFKLLPTPPKFKELIDAVSRKDYRYSFKWHLLTGGKKPIIECRICQKEGHLKQNCPEDTLPALLPLPPPNRQFIDAITRACMNIETTFKPRGCEIESRNNILHELRSFISSTYPDAQLELFGSSCNGFGFKGSDLDICLTFKNNEKGEGLNVVEIITTLAEKLKKCKSFYQVISIPTAKVPIVKFVHRSTRLECDISLYNALAQHNTKMLLLYSQIDNRVHILAYTMKFFAKLCGIGDASRGSLSSYAYNLMVLYFLQRTHPPIVPVLQELYDPSLDGPPKVMVDGWNAWFFNDLKRLHEVWPHRGKNCETVGELWIGLLRFYTEVFDFKKQVISIRQSKTLTRFEKLWNSKCIAIEDPFELSHNLGMGVSRKMNNFIMKTFIYGRSVFGFPISSLPRGYRCFDDFLFDPRLLTDGPPPNDRCCRVCGCIGHIARDCPRNPKKKGANDRLNRENENKSKSSNDVQGSPNKKTTSSKDSPKQPPPPKLLNSAVIPQAFPANLRRQWQHPPATNSPRQDRPRTASNAPSNLSPLLPLPTTQSQTPKNLNVNESPMLRLPQPFMMPLPNVPVTNVENKKEMFSINKPFLATQEDAGSLNRMPSSNQMATDKFLTSLFNATKGCSDNVPSSSSYPSSLMISSHEDNKAGQSRNLLVQQACFGPFTFEADSCRQSMNSPRTVSATSPRGPSIMPTARQAYSSASLPNTLKCPLPQKLPEAEAAFPRPWPVQNGPRPFAVQQTLPMAQAFPSLANRQSSSSVFVTGSTSPIWSTGVPVASPVAVLPQQLYHQHGHQPRTMAPQHGMGSIPSPPISSPLPQPLFGHDFTRHGATLQASLQKDGGSPSQIWPAAPSAVGQSEKPVQRAVDGELVPQFSR